MKFLAHVCMQGLHFSFNVQHDCETQGCGPTNQEAVYQDRVKTGKTKRSIQHINGNDFFIVNLHALHNAARIRKVLPRDLTRPVHCFPDRVARHSEMAEKLRDVQSGKRREAKEKAQAKKAKKAAEDTDGGLTANTSSAVPADKPSKNNDSDWSDLEPESEDELFPRESMDAEAGLLTDSDWDSDVETEDDSERESEDEYIL